MIISFNVIVALPVTKFTPASGGVGTTVTVTGKNFVAGQTAVKFRDVTVPAQNATVKSATQITPKCRPGLRLVMCRPQSPTRPQVLQVLQVLGTSQ